MKKMIVFLLAVTLLGTTLIGCSPKKTLIETLDDGFTDFLDAENFVHSSSQISFRDQVEQYTYNGQPLKDILQVIYLDGLTGGGCSGKGEHFGYTNNYERKLFSRKVNYTNSFYTKVALDNMTMPYGIDFDDTIVDVFGKMGIVIDLEKDFFLDEPNECGDAMTLYDKDGRTLVLHDHYKAHPLDDVAYHYTLVYVETYTAKRTDGKKTNVTRSIELEFGTDEVLSRVSIEVNENYKK